MHFVVSAALRPTPVTSSNHFPWYRRCARVRSGKENCDEEDENCGCLSWLSSCGFFSSLKSLPSALTTSPKTTPNTKIGQESLWQLGDFASSSSSPCPTRPSSLGDDLSGRPREDSRDGHSSEWSSETFFFGVSSYANRIAADGRADFPRRRPSSAGQSTAEGGSR